MAALASPVVFLGCVPPPQTFSTHLLQCVVGGRGCGGGCDPTVGCAASTEDGFKSQPKDLGVA